MIIWRNTKTRGMVGKNQKKIKRKKMNKITEI